MGQTIVVGGGISGAACARVLVDAGRDVMLLDRGRKLGGRMGVRTFDGRPVDTGASYFTAADPTFVAAVEDWQRRGLARPWTDTFAVSSADGEDTKTGPMRWAAPAGLRELVVDLTHGVSVESDHVVTAVTRRDGQLAVDGRPADTVVLAMPDPQARRLLSPELAGHDRLDAAYDPVLVLTTIWPERSWSDRDGIFVNGDDTVAFVIDDGLRRGDGAPVLVVHSTSEFAAARLDDPDAGTAPMLQRLREVVGLDASVVPSTTSMHRWSFAKPHGTREAPYLLTTNGLGVCGDGWSTKPRVEAAFLSGHQLGQAILDRS